MCDCVGVEIGSYANAVALMPPPELGFTRVPITVDRCLAEEVEHLWSLGIRTTGNCCGHNQQPGYIGVADESVPAMKALGYVVLPNPMCPGSENHFHPHSGRSDT